MSLQLAIDFKTGRAGALFPSTGDTTLLTYIEGGASIRSPERVVLSGNSAAIESPGTARRVATDVGVRSEEVTFANGDVVLAGQLILPRGAGPHPTVIFLHGSGSAPRGLFVSIGGYLAAHGIASLAYDKRGSGRSTGNWQTSTLVELADDAKAGIEFLRRRPEVDVTNIGLYGTSQGPWLSEIIASQDRGIRFIVSSSGGGLGGGVQEIYRRTRMLKESNYAPTDVEAARITLERYFAYLASNGADTTQIDQLWNDHSAKPWFKLILPVANPKLAPWPASRQVFARDLATDTKLPALQKKIQAPVLMIFGDDDQNVPGSIAIAAMREHLPGHDKQLTSIVLSGANHRFELKAEPGDIPRTHPDYYSTILDWIRKSIKAPR